MKAKDAGVLCFVIGLLFGMVVAFASCSPQEPPAARCDTEKVIYR